MVPDCTWNCGTIVLYDSRLTIFRNGNKLLPTKELTVTTSLADRKKGEKSYGSKKESGKENHSSGKACC